MDCPGPAPEDLSALPEGPVWPDPRLNPRDQFAALAVQLSPQECEWRDKERFLEEHGYQLRRRLRSGWVPSWESDPTLHPVLTEDFWPLPVR